MREEIEAKVRQVLAEHEHGGTGVDLASALTELVLGVIEEAGEWEYGVVADAFGGEPEPHPSLEACEHVREHTKTFYKKWTHGSKVTIYRHRKAGPWLPVEEVPA